MDYTRGSTISLENLTSKIIIIHIPEIYLALSAIAPCQLGIESAASWIAVPYKVLQTVLNCNLIIMVVVNQGWRLTAPQSPAKVGYFDSRAFYATPSLYNYGIIDNKEHYRNEQSKIRFCRSGACVPGYRHVHDEDLRVMRGLGGL
jgi:hypothetical protein